MTPAAIPANTDDSFIDIINPTHDTTNVAHPIVIITAPASFDPDVFPSELLSASDNDNTCINGLFILDMSRYDPDSPAPESAS